MFVCSRVALADRGARKRRGDRNEAVEGVSFIVSSASDCVARAGFFKKKGGAYVPLMQEEEHIARPEVRLPIPDDLKQRLVSDWDQIIHKNRVRPSWLLVAKDVWCGWVFVCVGGCMCGWVYVWVSGWVGVCMCGWVGGCVNRVLNKFLRLRSNSLPRGQLVKLPSTKPVSRILADYLTTVKGRGLSLATEIVAGLKVGFGRLAASKFMRIFTSPLNIPQIYFEEAIGTILLYKLERQQVSKDLDRGRNKRGAPKSCDQYGKARGSRMQYQQILDENKDAEMCDIYGGEHLLRLFSAFANCCAF
jgi:hypothetical protein